MTEADFEYTPKYIYIAGPMSGIPEFNFPAFHRAEDWLRFAGYKSFNPATKDIERNLDLGAYQTGDSNRAAMAGFDFREAYLWDVSKVIEADGIYMLTGWQHSPGAIGEHSVGVAMKRHYPEYEIMYEQ